jgi:hypothetical protein
VKHYGANKAVGNKNFPAMIEASAVKREFLAF